MVMVAASSCFRVLNVGQGLFYTGDITLGKNRVFKFIYDCGGDKVNDALDKYLGEDTEIDMLVISHFDSDHISGLPKLLNSVKKIKKIFIPYYNGLDSYLLLMAYVYGHGATFDNVEQIILVNTQNVLKPESKINFKRNVNFNFSEIDIDELNRGDWYKLLNVTIGEIRIGEFIVEDKWLFKFYNTNLNIGSSEEISEKILALIGRDGKTSLEEWLKFDLKKEELRLIYCEYCSNKDKNFKENQSSLFLFHTPIRREIDKIHILLFKKKEYKIQYFVDKTALGTILIGGACMKENENYFNFKNYYGEEINNIGLFLLPNYERINNWNERILDDFKEVKIFLDSSELESENHHSAELVKSFLMNGKIVLCSHEKQIAGYNYSLIYRN